MSQEDLEIVLGYFEASDLGEAVASLADDVTCVFHGETRHLAGAASFSGKDAAVEWLTDWFRQFDPGYRMEVNETLDLGDRILVVTTHHAMGRASGVPIAQRTVQVMTVADGKIVRQENFASRDDALEAAGRSK